MRLNFTNLVAFSTSSMSSPVPCQSMSAPGPDSKYCGRVQIYPNAQPKAARSRRLVLCRRPAQPLSRSDNSLSSAFLGTKRLLPPQAASKSKGFSPTKTVDLTFGIRTRKEGAVEGGAVGQRQR